MVKKVASHQTYIAKFIAVGLELITILNYQVPRKKIQYLLGSKNFPHHAVKGILYDRVVTRRVHPWALSLMG